MATVIRLQRGGRKKRPFYSVVVMDSRNRRDGAFIEKLGYYDPVPEPNVIKLDLERVKAWTDTGAKVSPRVANLIKRLEVAGSLQEAAPEPAAAVEESAPAGGKEEVSEPEAAASPQAGEEASESGSEATTADESEEGKEEAGA